MLVLNRKLGEKIRINDDIVVQVLEIKGKGIRLGIEAPAHVSILREELAGDTVRIPALILPAPKRR